MARVIGSTGFFTALFFSLAIGGAIAGCGSSPAAIEPDSSAADAGPDARDFCDPLVLAPVEADPCVLALPEGFLPQRVFFTYDDGDVALDRTDASSCEGAGSAFYVDSETAPTTATICPDACSALGTHSGTPEILATACGI